MSKVTQGRLAGAHVISEANGTLSRELVVITGAALVAGQVLGKITHAGATAAAYAGNTGTGTVGAITVGAGVKAGAYRLTIIEPAADSGRFSLEDPEGVEVGVGTVGVAFSGGGLSFTLSDATDFVAGDGFTITVAEGNLKYVAHDPALTNGAEVAAAVLYDSVDASLADKKAVVHVRLAEVSGSELVFKTGISTPDKAAALIALSRANLIAR